MRIGFVISFLELTGGHVAVVEIANRLVERGHEVSLVYPARSVASRRNDLLRRADALIPEALLRPFFRTNTSELTWGRFDGQIARIPDLEERWMPELDVIVATAWATAERVATFGSRTGTKVYFIQHYETWAGHEQRVDATWRGPFVRIATSEWLRSLAVERFGIDDVHVVPYGVDLDAFYPDAPPPPPGPFLRVGVLTHVEPWKGVADSLAAVRTAIDGGRPVQPVFFGQFAPPEDLPAGTELRIGIAREELRRLYSSLDVFLCGSWTESGPMTVPEAMACGTCVVSTDVGNVSLWSGGEAAYLAPPRHPDELARALVAALDDPGERARKAALGRELIQAYTWERAAREFAEIVEAAA
jgi:glycosyltransferase involved in cell wall biosynthesis